MPNDSQISDLFSPPPPSDTQIWERLPNETAKAYGAFVVYRQLPPNTRSLKKAVITLYGEWTASKMRIFQGWSSLYSWVARSTAWDDELDRVAREEQIKQVKDMRSRHIKLGQALQQKGVEKLRELDKAELTVGDVLNYILSGMRVERQAVGEPEEIKKTEAILSIQDYSQLSSEELRKALAQRLVSGNLDQSFPQTLPPATLDSDSE